MVATSQTENPTSILSFSENEFQVVAKSKIVFFIFRKIS